MPPKVRKNSQRSDGEQDGQLSKEQRDQRIKLFMQQFEKEAQERVNEMEAKLEQTLATLERVFRVELMKIPPATRNTQIKELLQEDEVSAGEITIAVKAASPEIWESTAIPLTRKLSKKAISSQGGASAPMLQRTLSVTGKKPLKDESKKTKARSLLSVLDAPRTSRVAMTSTTKRIQARIAKTGSEATASAPRARGIHSAGLRLPDSDGMNASLLMATATVSTSQGETLFLTDDLKDHIDVKMLDEMAILQMEQLRKLMDYLCNKVRQSQ